MHSFSRLSFPCILFVHIGPCVTTLLSVNAHVASCKSYFSFLDAKDATSLEYKLDTFSAVYKKLTGKAVSFEFAPTAEVF